MTPISPVVHANSTSSSYNNNPIDKKLDELLELTNALPLGAKNSCRSMLKLAAQDLRAHLDAYRKADKPQEVQKSLQSFEAFAKDLCVVSRSTDAMQSVCEEKYQAFKLSLPSMTVASLASTEPVNLNSRVAQAAGDKVRSVFSARPSLLVRHTAPALRGIGDGLKMALIDPIAHPVDTVVGAAQGVSALVTFSFNAFTNPEQTGRDVARAKEAFKALPSEERTRLVASVATAFVAPYGASKTLQQLTALAKLGVANPLVTTCAKIATGNPFPAKSLSIPRVFGDSQYHILYIVDKEGVLTMARVYQGVGVNRKINVGDLNAEFIAAGRVFRQNGNITQVSTLNSVVYPGIEKVVARAFHKAGYPEVRPSMVNTSHSQQIVATETATRKLISACPTVGEVDLGVVLACKAGMDA